MESDNTTIKGKSYASRAVSDEHETERFVNCDFSGADFSGAGFVDCVFEGCNFSLARVSGTRFVGVDFRNCKLVGVGLRLCDKLPIEVSFSGCKIAHCDFFGLPLAKTKFSECDILECVFERTDLRKADFSGSILTGSRFAAADLRKADFSRARDYAFDLTENCVKGVKVALPEAVKLLTFFDIDISGETGGFNL